MRLGSGALRERLASDAGSSVVTVGPREALERTSLTASRVNWMSGETPASPVRAGVQIRYRHLEAPATVTPIDGARARVDFDSPQSAITPGQAVVFYEGEVVMGGGWID